MSKRGRPKGAITTRRAQVLERYLEAAEAGERINRSRMARECQLGSYRNVSRILRDLSRLGLIAQPNY